MACGELFLYAWHCYWMLTVDRSAGPFAGLRSTILRQRKSKAIIQTNATTPENPFPPPRSGFVQQPHAAEGAPRRR